MTNLTRLGFLLAGAADAVTAESSARNARREVPILELHPQRELSGSARLGGVDNGKARRPKRMAGQIEIGVIEEIEEFRANLKAEAIPDGERFDQRGVDVYGSGSIQNGTARGSKTKSGRGAESVGIEPAR